MKFKSIQSMIDLIPEWGAFVLFFLACLGVFGLIKKLAYSRLRKLSQFQKWGGEALLRQVSLPSWLLIVAITLQLGGKAFDLKKNWQEALGSASLVFFTISFILVLNRVLTVLFQSFAQKQGGMPRAEGFGKTLIQIGVWVIGLMILMDSLGISITPLIASLGIGSVAAGLALQDTLSNLFSGFYLMVDRPLRVGDFIRLENGMEGYVEMIGWRSTRVKLLAHNVLIIPNSKIATSVFVNFYLPHRESNFTVSINVDYDHDLEHVEKITFEEAKKTLQETVGGIADFDPVIRFSDFSERGVLLNVTLRSREFSEQTLLKHELIKRLNKRYKQESIYLAFQPKASQDSHKS